jgi:spore germination protein YaaH
MEKLKNSTQGIENVEWLGFFYTFVVNPSPRFYTSKEFRPSMGINIQKGVEILKDLEVYNIRSYSRLMILLKERKRLTCISR